MLTLHSLSALAATAALGAGMLGIGRLLGGADPVTRWVRGWTALWWLMALTAQLAGPLAAVVVGSAAVLGGLGWWAHEARTRPRALLAGGGAVLAGAPLFLCPPYFYDALVYHLGLPWTWLVNSSFDPIPHHLFSHFPLAVPTVYLLPVAWGLPEAAAGLHWLCLAVALVATHRLATRLGAGRWAVVAPILLVGCWHVVWVAGLAAADLLVLVAIVAAVEALAGGDRPRWLDAGLALGLAAAAKYPAAVPVAAVLLAAVIASPRRWRAVVRAGAVATVAWSFVWIRNLLVTGNPVYPLLWGVFGGSGWSDRDQSRWAGLVHEGVDGVASLATGLLRLVRPPIGAGWWLLLALPLVALALAGRDDDGRRRRLVGAMALACLLGWLTSSQTTRYAFPLLALVAVLAAAGVPRVPRRWGAAAATVLALGVLHGLYGLGAFTLGTLGLHRLWAGEASAEEWRSRVTVNDPLPAYRGAGEILPDDARLLVVGEGRSWGCPPPHHVSSPYDLQAVQELVERSADAAEVARELAAAGWSHLLINRGELERLGGDDFLVLRWQDPADAARWRRFLSDSTTPLNYYGPCELRALLPPPGGRSGEVEK